MATKEIEEPTDEDYREMGKMTYKISMRACEEYHDPYVSEEEEEESAPNKEAKKEDQNHSSYRVELYEPHMDDYAAYRRAKGM